MSSYTTVVEPPRLYGPHAHVFVPKISNGYACVTDNLKEYVRVSQETSDKPHTTKIAWLSKHRSHTEVCSVIYIIKSLKFQYLSEYKFDSKVTQLIII